MHPNQQSIDARFHFNPQGQIASHRDSFDFCKAGANLRSFVAREPA